LTYLDTHVVVWLHAGDDEALSRSARRQIDDDDLYVSPAVLLELEYLREIKRIRYSADRIVGALSREIDLRVCDLSFAAVAGAAIGISWIRDPFDRLIVGHAAANAAALITKDRTIRKSYAKAVW